MKEYNYDKDYYMHGLCHYFAIAFVELFGGKIHLWLDDVFLDEDEDIPSTVLCHAYVELAPNVFVDANGVFSDIEEREDDFEFNEQNIVECNLSRAKEILKDLKIPFTNVEDKRNVREYLRNNMLLFKVFYGNHKYNLGLYGRTNAFGVESLQFVSYNNHSFNKFVSTFSVEEFSRYIMNETKKVGFVENKGWYYKR